MKKITSPKKEAKSFRAARAAMTKQERIIHSMKQPKGASMAELIELTDWQPHTVRGFISRTLKKKLALPVELEKVAVGSVYRIAV
jgi:hypothetical protein